MSESMSSPWIRDYFMDVAETFGAQIYNAPLSSGKKKVQLTDFLTYQENSYVWAWISDKDCRVSVRISEDAAGQYKKRHGRKIIDCRFSVVVISNYRPMFSPRPLGSNTTGNTPIAHISLEISQVKLVGIGGHLFGNPRDLESNVNVKEWVLGLRQDGGGGNVLKLRKQEENKKAQPSPSPSSPPPFSLYAPVSQCQATKTEHTAKPKSERPEDFKRTYTKRWRIVDTHPWKFATKPAAEKSVDLYPSPPRRIPSPTSRLQRQGTPSDWSPSNRGSPVAPDAVTTTAVRDGIQQHDEPTTLPLVSNLLSNTEEHATVDTTITSDTRSFQPPTPAQRIRHSPPRPNSPSRSSPDVFACSSPLPSQQLSCSFPLPLSSPLSLAPPSLPVPTSIRKNIQRKVPRPGSPVPRPDPTKQGPVQILVPNSDTGSSQSYSQSQQPSQSRQSQHQLFSCSPAFPSSLAKDFEPPDTSTPKEGKPGNSTRHTSRMFAESMPAHCDTDENETVPTGDRGITEEADTNLEEQEVLDLTQPPALSVPRIEVLEIGTSDPEEEADKLQLTHSTARTEVGFDAQAGTKDMGKGGSYARREHAQRSIDKAHPTTQNSPPHQPSCIPVASVIQQASPNGQGTGGVSELPGSQGSMHSLFSDLLEDERTVSSRTPIPAGRTRPNVQERASPAHVPRHDPVAWKEPSFLARNKGKGKARAVEEPDTPSMRASRKRQHVAQPELPRLKRRKVSPSETRQTTSGQAIQLPDTEASAIATEEIHASNRPTTPPKPRLAKFAVDFKRVDLGRRVPIPTVDLDRDMKTPLLRTGRIRTLGKEVVENGKAYTMI